MPALVRYDVDGSAAIDNTELKAEMWFRQGRTVLLNMQEGHPTGHEKRLKGSQRYDS